MGMKRKISRAEAQRTQRRKKNNFSHKEHKGTQRRKIKKEFWPQRTQGGIAATKRVKCKKEKDLTTLDQRERGWSLRQQ
jgi:hypothetical protein